MTSLFRRLSKYTPSPLLDPRENRLTEAFAAVLEEADRLPAAVAGAWLGITIDPALPVQVRTQRATVSQKYIDLELVFGDLAVPELRVWVEIKHGADLLANQVENYERDLLAEAHGRTEIVLLAPRDSMPQPTAETTSVSWQDTARILQTERKSRRHDEVASWLLRQLIDYLKEEGLTDAEALTPADAFVLAARPSADRTVARLLQFADEYVIEHWGPPVGFGKSGGSKQNYSPGFWWSTHEVARPGKRAPATWRKSKFDWSLDQTAPGATPRDAYAFCAGATFLAAKNSPVTVKGNEEWLAARQAAGFEYVSDWYWRLWRFLYPEQLMADDTLEAQGRRLGAWIVETFELLAAAPPPQ